MINEGVMTEKEYDEKKARGSNGVVVTNSTSENVLVYGPARATDGGSFGTSWYVLHPGETTPRNGNFQGLYIPKDRNFVDVNGKTVQGPAAVRYSASKSVTITGSENQYLEKNQHNDGIYHSNEINWPIPDFSSADCQKMNKVSYEVENG